jgi:hypothetical protein
MLGVPWSVEYHMERMQRMDGISAHGVVVRNGNRRHTGAPDTSDGNSNNSIDLFQGLCLRVLGADRMERETSAIILGDDTLFIMTRSAHDAIAPVIEGYYRDRGITLEFISHSHPAFVEFCSMRFLPTNEGWRLSPKPGRLLAKALWRIAGQSPLSDADWVTAVTTGLVHDASHVPLLAQWVEAMRAAHGISDKLWAQLRRGNSADAFQFHGTATRCVPEAWDWQSLVYGLGVDDVRRAAHALAAHTSAGMLSHWVWRLVSWIDCGPKTTPGERNTSFFDEQRPTDQFSVEWLHEAEECEPPAALPRVPEPDWIGT